MADHIFVSPSMKMLPDITVSFPQRLEKMQQIQLPLIWWNNREHFGQLSQVDVSPGAFYPCFCLSAHARLFFFYYFAMWFLSGNGKELLQNFQSS